MELSFMKFGLSSYEVIEQRKKRVDENSCWDIVGVIPHPVPMKSFKNSIINFDSCKRQLMFENLKDYDTDAMCQD